MFFDSFHINTFYIIHYTADYPLPNLNSLIVPLRVTLPFILQLYFLTVVDGLSDCANMGFQTCDTKSFPFSLLWKFSVNIFYKLCINNAYVVAVTRYQLKRFYVIDNIIICFHITIYVIYTIRSVICWFPSHNFLTFLFIFVCTTCIPTDYRYVYV